VLAPAVAAAAAAAAAARGSGVADAPEAATPPRLLLLVLLLLSASRVSASSWMVRSDGPCGVNMKQPAARLLVTSCLTLPSLLTPVKSFHPLPIVFARKVPAPVAVME
jgi:hypothetical protein